MESLPANPTPLLIVDDDEGLLLSLQATLVSQGLPEAALTSDPTRALDLVAEHRFKVVLLDLIMPQLSGLEVLARIKAEHPQTECIIVTAHDDVPSAVEAVQLGAYDYLVKPVDPDRLTITIGRALERYDLRRELDIVSRPQSFADLARPEAFESMVAHDPAMAVVFHQAEAVAATDYNVLLVGESGTGKELMARIIHALSPRGDREFVRVNLAALSSSLFEDDLFGHDKGAFTNAQGGRAGLFEEADQGTLFLDEITELDSPLQAKLLRVIQEGEYYRLGQSRPRRVDVRLVAASNRDIDREVAEGRFRNDLFHRLNTFRITIPPLRHRPDDILPLANHFLAKHARLCHKAIPRLSDQLINRLTGYAYPGNVRELENIIASAVVRETGPELSPGATDVFGSAAGGAKTGQGDFPTLRERELDHIRAALEATGQNRTRAAKLLGIGLRTLQRKLKELDRAEDQSQADR